ncbi:MAG: carbohydrate ABC transporter permease [Eubacterium sp.]|nr:carbohydrate ABC transporter permease [Eubacterium sp.]
MKKNKRSAGFRVKRAIIYICLTILAAACLLPFLLMIVNATREGRDIMTSFTFIPGGIDTIKANWDRLHKNVDIFRGLLNSVIVAVPATILSAYFSSITAYALAVYKFKGNKLIFSVTVVFMMIPGQLSLIGFFQLVRALDMYDTYWPLILPAIAAPGAVFFLRQYILSILPRTLLEAARIDGGKELYIFHRIVLPLIAPGIATMSIGGFIANWNNYLMPLIMLKTPEKFTLPLMVTTLNDALDVAKNQGAIYMCLAISVLPIMIVFCFCSKYIIGSITAGGVKE